MTRRATCSGRPASIRCTARGPLKRAIQQQIENPLAQRILQGEFVPGDRIRVSVQDGELGFSKRRSARRRASDRRGRLRPRLRYNPAHNPRQRKRSCRSTNTSARPASSTPR